MRSWAASERNASRSVGRLTPNSRASVASFGSREPGGSMPSTTRAPSSAATCSYCFPPTSAPPASFDAELEVPGEAGRGRRRHRAARREEVHERGAVPLSPQLAAKLLGGGRVDLERPLVGEHHAVGLPG